MTLKRCVDVAGALLGLLLVWPLGLAVAVAVRLDSPGPVLFRQQRVGWRGRLFRIHKFRTMRADGLPGPLVTAGSDARITRVGRVLRRYKLDELPQLIDVLRGEMSLVGPRPEVPRYMALYADGVRHRILSVRPGITDPATILFRDEESLLAAAPDAERAYIETIMPIKQRHYLDYVAHHSVSGDLVILLRTVGAVLSTRRGKA